MRLALMALLLAPILLLGCTSSNSQQVQVQPSIDSATGAFIVEADDSGLYPATLQAEKGSTVKILFKVRTKEVYFGGIAFKSDMFKTGDVKPGSQELVTFTMPDKEVVYTSYWPANGAKKADGYIKVK